jgi:hypothetical protein
MSDEREQILSAVDYWRLHANDPKAQGGFAGATVTDLRTILDHIDTLTRERDEARRDAVQAKDTVYMWTRSYEYDVTAQRKRADMTEAEADTLKKQRDEAKRDAERLCGALAGSWLYGDWKAETLNEREQEAVMRRLGWWPITEADLIARRDADSGCLGAPFCSKGCCGPQARTADAEATP